MKVSRVIIKKIEPKEGHVGFCSLVIDNWLYLGNIALWARLNDKERIRLVFPEKRVGDKRIAIFYPLDSKIYFELEEIVSAKFKEL